jgi:glutamate---cysteine ligase / carboxylate-amine ligase
VTRRASPLSVRRRAKARSTDAADAFGRLPEYTVGVEEELMLLDPITLGLVSGADDVVRSAADPERIKQEIRQSMVEIASSPALTTDDLHRELRMLRRDLLASAARHGCRVAAAGAHPFSRAETQELTDKPRYRYVAGISGWVGRRSTAVCGTHVHVGLGSAEKALGVMEAILPDLPLIAALAASSPLWEGQDTGFASARLAVRSELPRSGMPPLFRSYADYREQLGQLRAAGLVPDASYLWWDVRLQERLGTIEVRILDAQPSVHDTAAFAGLVQSLARYHGTRWDQGERVESPRLLVDENRWQAVRHGMSATLVGRNGAPVTARAALDTMLDAVAEDATSVGAAWVLDHLSDLADRGGPAVAVRDRFVLTDDAREATVYLVETGEKSVRGTGEVSDAIRTH